MLMCNTNTHIHKLEATLKPVARTVLESTRRGSRPSPFYLVWSDIFSKDLLNFFEKTSTWPVQHTTPPAPWALYWLKPKKCYRLAKARIWNALRVRDLFNSQFMDKSSSVDSWEKVELIQKGIIATSNVAGGTMHVVSLIPINIRRETSYSRQ